MAGVSTAGVFFGNLAIVGLANSTNGGYDGAMTTVSDIADTLGRGAIAQAVGVRATAVSNAVARDKRFPPSWFLVVSRMSLRDEGHKSQPSTIRG
jgi:hypothetical protein